jgi:hypothetical protein
MRCIPKLLGAAIVALVLAAAPGRSAAQGSDSAALHRTLTEFARLRADLDKINAEVADLKRSDRSVRNDYRLRDRLADAEALAQKVTQVEARLRALGWTEGAVAGTGARVAPPQAMPQDGSVELEAKADLFADQANKLAHQADTFTRAADQLRTRKALRRRASAWERDPFAGLESSKRNLATSSTTTKMPANGAPSSDIGSRSGSTPTTITSESSGKSASGVGAIESPASKSSPLAPGVSADRQLEQRLFLDPTTAAELRQVLGAGAAISDPDALDRAAAALRARARELGQRADAIRRKILAP